MDESSPTPVIRDTPWMLWILGALVGGLAIFMAPSPPWRAGPILGFVALCTAQLLLFTRSSLLTIQVDADGGCLVLMYRSLLSKRVNRLSLDEIASIDIEASAADGRSDRVVISLRDGQVTPLRRYYTTSSKERLAKSLRELTGVGGSHIRTNDDIQMIRQRHQALIAEYADMRETSGVRWKVQEVDLGRLPVTRWFSPDSRTNGEFVYIAQRPTGQLFPGGIIGRSAMRVALGLYSFSGEDVPRLDAATLVSLDDQLAPDFVAFASDASAAAEIVDPRVVGALAAWAAQHPLHTIRVGYCLGPLSVLFSPQGVYAVTSGISDSAQLDELVAVGVQLVNAQAKARL